MDVNVKNYMEDCVNSYIDMVMKETGMCTCERCKLDVIALALNELPPKYVATKKGQLYSKLNILESQFSVDVIAALTKAVNVVKENKRHDD